MLPYTPPLPFSQPLLDRYVAVIQRAYDVNEEHHDPDLGHTDGSFFYLLYESIKYFLPGALSDIRAALVELDSNAVVVTEGTRSLRSYHIGASEYDDPWTSFPKNDRGAPATAAHNAEQLRIFSDEQLVAPGEIAGLHYILGHCGTPERGLRAVYLCLPYGAFADDRIRRYLHVWPIFRPDGTTVTPAYTERPPSQSPVVQVSRAPVTLRPRSDAYRR